MLIVNFVPYGLGWNPINYMVSLAGELLEADVIHGDPSIPSTLTKLQAIVNKRTRIGNEHETCLCICSGPNNLLQILNITQWRRRFRFLAAWIIDSFWIDWIPRSIRLSKPFDHYFITSAEDVAQWKSRTGVNTTCLPWGTDALRLGGNSVDREWDLTRIGRQPSAWNNDHETAVAAARRNIRFHPRLSDFGMTPIENQKSLMALYGRTKYLLAFSNIANPTKHSHPIRQYLTGRWVDALGGGAVVAGIAPTEPSIDALLWPEATIDLPVNDSEAGLDLISSALKTWSPQIAERNHARALQRLDWRWRLKEIAEKFETKPNSLQCDFDLLQAKLKQEKYIRYNVS